MINSCLFRSPPPNATQRGAAPSCLARKKVSLLRNNVKEGEKAAPVYAPKYPLFADEGWWVLVGDINRKTIFSFERITDNGREVSKEVSKFYTEVFCIN